MPTPTTAELFARVAANRHRAADLLAGLTADQWQTPSLCAGWTLRDLAGHLLMPMELSTARFLIELVRARGHADLMVDRMSRELGRRPTAEIVDQLRRRAGSVSAPPIIGAYGPMADSCIHLSDATRPLGRPVLPPLDDWRIVLDFLVQRRASFGFVPKGRLTGLALRATDQDWRFGAGAEVVGTSEALALAITGRSVVLPELTGTGVELLASRSVTRRA